MLKINIPVLTLYIALYEMADWKTFSFVAIFQFEIYRSFAKIRPESKEAQFLS